MNLKLILKGFIVGVGKIIPGVSGSMLAIFLGVYEELLDAVTHFFDNPKKNLYLLGNFCFGVLLAIVFFSKILLFLLGSHYYLVMYLFLGLIIGSILPFSKTLNFNLKNKIVFLVFLILFLILSLANDLTTFVFSGSLFDYIYVSFLGFIDAVTSIVPGISGTAIFMLLGVYEFVLAVMSNPISIEFIFYGMGLILGIIITCYVMNYLLKNKKEETNSIIFAFMVGSILILSLGLLNHFQIWLLAPLLIGLIIGNFFDK